MLSQRQIIICKPPCPQRTCYTPECAQLVIFVLSLLADEWHLHSSQLLFLLCCCLSLLCVKLLYFPVALKHVDFHYLSLYLWLGWVCSLLICSLHGLFASAEVHWSMKDRGHGRAVLASCRPCGDWLSELPEDVLACMCWYSSHLPSLAGCCGRKGFAEPNGATSSPADITNRAVSSGALCSPRGAFKNKAICWVHLGVLGVYQLSSSKVHLSFYISFYLKSQCTFSILQ